MSNTLQLGILHEEQQKQRKKKKKVQQSNAYMVTNMWPFQWMRVLFSLFFLCFFFLSLYIHIMLHRPSFYFDTLAARLFNTINILARDAHTYPCSYAPRWHFIHDFYQDNTSVSIWININNKTLVNVVREEIIKNRGVNFLWKSK